MKHFTLVIAIMAFFALSASAQKIQEEQSAKDGTYQIIVQPTKLTPVFTTTVLVQIEAWRHDTEDKTVELQPDVMVYIPSRATVNAASFKELEPIIYQ
jgi:major membrane immunogen (membrane-anchored lipoprotein)